MAKVIFRAVIRPQGQMDESSISNNNRFRTAVLIVDIAIVRESGRPALSRHRYSPPVSAAATANKPWINLRCAITTSSLVTGWLHLLDTILIFEASWENLARAFPSITSQAKTVTRDPSWLTRAATSFKRVANVYISDKDWHSAFIAIIESKHPVQRSNWIQNK